jgi:hypothetical protein
MLFIRRRNRGALPLFLILCCDATLLKFKLGLLLVKKFDLVVIVHGATSHRRELPMSHKTSISRAGCVGIALAAVVVSFGAQSAAARPSQHHHLYAMHRGPYAPPAALPHTPEYGFLNHVPANAIREPGYTFVPLEFSASHATCLRVHVRTSTTILSKLLGRGPASAGSLL